jgi:NADP-dependent 3-hydroxy acid dehydrogenase YdfG
MKSLENRLALVTGASSGIGAAIARALTAAGARCVLAARRADRLDRLAAELKDSERVSLDVRDAAAVLEALASFEFDIAVANAGLGLGLEPVQRGDPEDWSTMLDTNVKGLLHTVRAVAPGMERRRRGDIVLIGSVAGRQVYPGGNVYCASKWAVRGIYESLRIDMAGSGVRITTVDPGMVRTDFSLVRFKGDSERAGKVYAGVEALTPEDVADAVAYAVTRPAHVNIGEIVIWATAQASTTVLEREKC